MTKNQKSAIIVTPYAEPEKGACTIRVNFFRKTLEGFGFAVRIIAPLRGKEQASGVERVKSKLEMMGRIIAAKPSIVIGVSPPIMPNIFALVAAKFAGAKFILDAKDLPTSYSPKLKFSPASIRPAFFLCVMRLVYALSDSLLFLAKSDRVWAMRECSIPSERAFVVANGTQTGIVRPDAAARKSMRKRLGIGQNDIAMVYVGSIADEEVVEFLEISALAIRGGIKCILVLAHENDPASIAILSKIREVIASNNIEKNVSITSNVKYDEIYKYLSAADIGVLPWPDNLKTSIPAKVYDYCAGGLFVLAKGPQDSELSDFMQEHSLGALFSTWKLFGKYLSQELIAPAQLRKIGAKNRVLAVKLFDRSLQSQNLGQAIGHFKGS